MAFLGKRNTLSVVRAAAPGLYLDGGELGEILLPGRYIPADLKPKDQIDVFIYRDSEDRLVATTEIPYVTVGEFGCLRVVSVNDRVGAFLDWGLAKDLLMPFREQEGQARVGQRLVVFVYLDPKTERIVATSRLRRHLSRERPLYRNSHPVDLLITGQTPLGYTAIVDNAYSGLLYHDNIMVPLQIGQRLNGFVRNLRQNGQIDLSLDAGGYRRVAPLTDEIVEALQQNGGLLPFDDDSSPEAIRDKFSVSKKAFKQALGKLYKARRIAFKNPGIELLDNSSWSPRE
ncbi:MAG TPA: S1-like domain-containing RNA-binding protein [Verrucomicrobiae bacterium]|nr:S1-like domain-containing RNA-binding protein [Verrucomicrobiae bacterium]